MGRAEVPIHAAFRAHGDRRHAGHKHQGCSQDPAHQRDEAWHILNRAVERGLRRKEPRLIKHLGVDEKAIARGQRYFTLVCDLDLGTVEHIGDGRDRRSFESYLDSLTSEQLPAIIAIAMDMHEAYVQAALAKIPDAEQKIVFDLFHIMQHMSGAVDEVRRKEHQALIGAGDRRLARTRYMWLYGKEKVPRKYWDAFCSLRKSDLKTAKACSQREFAAILAIQAPICCKIILEKLVLLGHPLPA